jgi:hypothetical protein
MSPYSYAANDPFVYTDPSGLREMQVTPNPIQCGDPASGRDAKTREQIGKLDDTSAGFAYI